MQSLGAELSGASYGKFAPKIPYIEGAEFHH